MGGKLPAEDLFLHGYAEGGVSARFSASGLESQGAADHPIHWVDPGESAGRQPPSAGVQVSGQPGKKEHDATDPGCLFAGRGESFFSRDADGFAFIG